MGKQMPPVLVDKRLRGTWKSDRRLTFKHYVPPPRMTPAGLRRFKAIFGKLVVRWGTSYLYIDLEGFRSKEPYELVDRDSVSVVIKSFNDIFQEHRLTQIFFEDDCYWFWTPWGMREFFRRIK